MANVWAKGRSRTFAASLGLALAGTALTLAGTLEAAFAPEDPSWEGATELAHIAQDKLGKSRVHLVSTLPWEEVQPIDAVLVLHPNHELDYREVAAFLAAGGRLGLLDDYGRGDALLLRFRIHRVQPPLDPKDPLRDNANLQVALPSVVPGARPHPVVTGVDRVVTNHPTGLETDPTLRLTTVLELPAVSGPSTALALIGVIGDAKRCGLVSDTGDEPVTTNANASGRCGRLFAMGDPSAVMNLMLRYPGNRAFAGRLVEYLVGDDTWGKRGGSLYVVENDFVEHGSFGKREGALGALDDRLEALSRFVSDTRREGLPAAVAVVLAAAAAGIAAMWAVSAATRRYRRVAPRYARATPLVAQGGLAGRAAVLAADTTHRALAVLELKAALEEALRDRLGLKSASIAELTQEIDRQAALSQRNSTALKDVIRQMARAEEAVTRAERIRIPTAQVRAMHEAMQAILSELDQPREGRP